MSGDLDDDVAVLEACLLGRAAVGDGAHQSALHMAVDVHRLAQVVVEVLKTDADPGAGLPGGGG